MTVGDRLRIGAALSSAGLAPTEIGVPAMADRLEAAGYESIWCSDHVVMTPNAKGSFYPFSDDGVPGWDADTPWYDALVVMAQAAAVTTRVEIGCAVMVLPLRHPVVLAKQVASLDRLAGGRVALGVGVGWYREEFEALGIPFDSRGPRADEWLELLRRCWTGRPEAFDGDHFKLPPGVIHEPTPYRRVPLLVGGMSTAALRRASRQDGWLALQRAGHLDPEELGKGAKKMREYAAAEGRDPADLRVVVRIIESHGRVEAVAASVAGLFAAGADEIVVDCDLTGDGDEHLVFDRLADAANEVMK